ncbi:putative disease resistance protein RGA3 [Dioscorea cayenensis subsp. rotundata]|uniref:Disease resistance protein RGA3 n=1 Tax=Dioscorea cayennensis subsp. rotundata TaxID=55577 RepID=A0AB40CNG0_DIOCR|nr:putative disease resistance protein RGA3 [Dioscorea cayenensis subsp. rotundata]XP_039141621.1 putative disease resistance protein RGA3 [Dioscorea cayenensis subsp. rotundata]XP_039141622.1 putative disease resistance protein RGA3 [Dioscorea cayenensis subsp. rotundata]XP_039141623.1 putative disease resistance protein RGA3 [Dioscorea cayenensis subsp. rotundata]XP_039141624.1 putative disease resistance protein RGA3 [Dioscorea cayenensis subsp. rotundata]XP_039141625.1 putative disease res
MYDAEDIIDLCMIQGMGLLQDDHHHTQLAESSAAASTRVRCCNFPLFSCVRSVPFRYEIADKIKSLNDRLSEISDDKDKFHFIISSKSSDDSYVMNEASYWQSSFLPESDIVGWDIIDATNSLVELLVSQHQQKCRLFAIVGMGGIGKTTLAQLIYNDSKINDDFVLHSWICVSKFYTSKTDLLKELIKNVGGTCGEATTTTELQKILCDVLHGKSLFLVLDDVWDADVWINLIKKAVERTTKCGVVVTTRDRNTAIKMKAIHIHNVNKLPLNFGWELLCKKVFTNNDEGEIQRMKDIGMQIVEKCDGLPVAIKAIAGVLITTEQNKREWENILNSDAWTITGLPEELRGALYLSYDALPSALKHCFLYCSFNPPDRSLFYEDLVCEWIAEGFIEANGDASMEDVAKGYYMELIRRSFLQPDPNYANMYKCTMHDLLRALAIFLIGGENLSGDPQASQSNGSMIKLRRLTISSNRESVSIPRLDCLRNLRLWTPPSLDTQIIGSFKQLRVLVLNGVGIKNIPNNIGDLVHLRLLDLDDTRICKLPDSVGSLINLQFLSLADCEALDILPRSITSLCNLRRLYLNNTPVNYVPKGMGKLEHLNHLAGFIVEDADGDNGEGCSMEDLQMLKNLRHLQIDKLEKASKSTAVLLNKSHLKTVVLCCTPNVGGCNQQKMDRIVQVFDELCPPKCLDRLQILNYFGEKYPQWMSSNSISTALLELTSLQLINCYNFPQLPQLGQLPQLKYLKIQGATSVISIGCEFLGNGKLAASAFPKLEYLILWNMTNWEQWSLVSGEEDKKIDSSKLIHFPCLQLISIDGCPKLKAFPRGLNHVPKLYLVGAHSLSRISDLPALRELKVRDCPMLDCVEKLESLQSLKISEHVDNLPNWLISFLQQCEKHHANRFHLHLTCSAQALKGCLKGHTYWCFLQQVPRLEAYAENESMYLKYTKEPYSYQTNLDEDTIDED